MSEPNPNPSHATRFQPGQSGNPAGRPKGSGQLTRIMAEILEGDTLGELKAPPGKTINDLVAAAIIQHAMEGRPGYAGLILDRLEGRMGQRVELSGDADAAPVMVKVLKGVSLEDI